MAKITDYTAATRFNSGDVLIKDGTAGTRTITAANAAIEFAGLISPTNHRNVYRGKSLGTSITSEQLAAIRAGTFDDLFIGDYWTINGHAYEIADMDYWYNTGDTAFTSHHLVMIPRSSLYNAQMNETNTTEGGYVGSLMYTTNLEAAKTQISTDFGDNLLTHREYLVNAVTDGYPSAGAWYDSSVELMNEIMVYGSLIRSARNSGTNVPNTYTIDKQQLAIFLLAPRRVNIRATQWLRDVVSAANFALVNSNGVAHNAGASYSVGVRPVFPIG